MSSTIRQLSPVFTGTRGGDLSTLFTPEEERILKRDDRMAFIYEGAYLPPDMEARGLMPYREALRNKLESINDQPFPQREPSIRASYPEEMRHFVDKSAHNYSMQELGQGEKEAFEKLLFYFAKNIKTINPKMKKVFGFIVKFSQKVKNRAENDSFTAEELLTDVTEIVVKNGMVASIAASSGPLAPGTALALKGSELANILRGLIKPHLDEVIKENEKALGKSSIPYHDLWPYMKLGSAELVKATFDLLAAPDQTLTDAAHMAVKKGKEELIGVSKLAEGLGSLSLHDLDDAKAVNSLSEQLDALSTDDYVGLLEKQQQKIRGIIADVEKDIQSHDTAQSENRKGFWLAAAMAAGNALVEAATDYITTQNQMDAVASNVKHFVQQFEQQKARLNQKIQTDNREEVREELFRFFEKIQNPNEMARSYDELKKSGQKLTCALAELKENEKSLMAEANEQRDALAACGEKEKKYKRSLAKAIRSGKRAGKRAGIFSSILKTAGAILCAIPGPTQLVGAAVVATTQAVGSFVDHNRNSILDSRITKQQNRLNQSLEVRGTISDRLNEISNIVLEIDRAQKGIDSWIMDSESRGALLVEDRLKEQQRIVEENEKEVGNIRGKVSSKQAEIAAKKDEYSKREEILNGYRAIPGLDVKSKYKKEWTAYCELLKVQKACQAGIDQLDSERQRLENNDLPNALDLFNQNSKTFKKESEARFLATAGQRIEQMMEADASKVSLREKLVAANMKKFEELQNTRSAASSTMIEAGGELAAALYHSTGVIAPYHVYCMAFHAHKACLMVEKLQEGSKEWVAFFTNPDGSLRVGSSREFGQDNYVNCFVAPTVRAVASSIAVLNAAYSLCRAGAYTLGLWKPTAVKSEAQLLFDALQSELGRCTNHLTRWMSDVHKDLTQQNRALYENINRMRSELGVLGRELCLRLEKDKQAMVGELEQDRFTTHCHEVQKQIAKLQKMGIEFRNYPNRDEKEWLNYLGKIKGMLNLCLDPRMNGYTIENRDEEFFPSVGLDRLYRNPEFFTGLLAKHLGKKGQFPNGALLKAIQSECTLIELSPSCSAVILKDIEDIKSNIVIFQRMLAELYLDISSLIKKLHSEQKALFDRLQQSQKKWAERKVQFCHGLKEAMRSFENFGKAAFVGKGRFFLYSEVATKSFEALLPDFDYKRISHRALCGNSMGSLLRTQGAVLTASVGLFVLSPRLAACTLFVGFGRRMLYDYTPLLKYEDRIKPSLRDKNAPELIEEQKADSAVPSCAEKKSLGIDLKTRKVVVLTGKSSEVTPFVNLAMSMKVDWVIPYLRDPALHLQVELAANSSVTKEELVRIVQSSEHIWDSSSWIQKLAEDYSAVVKAYVDKKPCETEFTTRLGEYRFLLSKDNQTIPLAFPAVLMEELESQISMEIAYAEKCDIGMLLPHYEFSSEKGVLSIVYSFIDQRQAKPYCRFNVGHFDSATLASFEKELCDSNGRIDSRLKDPNEFLLQMMYSGLAEGNPMPAMPGDKTIQLASGLVAPADRPFVGLYKILQKAPDIALHFNCGYYTQENQSALDAWINNAAESYPEVLIRPAEGPKFFPDFLEIWQQIFDGKKQIGSSASYQNNYYLVLSLLKLTSSQQNHKLVNALAGAFSIYSPAMRDGMVDRDEKMARNEIEDDKIVDFLCDLVEK